MDFNYFFGALLIAGISDYLFIIAISGILGLFKYEVNTPIEIRHYWNK